MRELSDNHNAGGNADAYAESLGRWPQLTYGLDQLEACRDGPLGIILLGHRITEIRKNAIAQISGDQATAGFHDFRRLAQIRSKDVIEILGIEALGEGYRAHKIAKHHAELPALGSGSRRS
jgi:hypothetical protein